MHFLDLVYISISYFSHRYFTTLGGKSLVVGRMPLASKKARSVFSQRRNVSGLTPAARASSIFVRDFINITHFYQFHKYSTHCYQSNIILFLILLISSASLRYPFGRRRKKDDFSPRSRGDDLTTEPHGTTRKKGYIFRVSVPVRARPWLE